MERSDSLSISPENKENDHVRIFFFHNFCKKLLVIFSYDQFVHMVKIKTFLSMEELELILTHTFEMNIEQPLFRNKYSLKYKKDDDFVEIKKQQDLDEFFQNAIISQGEIKIFLENKEEVINKWSFLKDLEKGYLGQNDETGTALYIRKVKYNENHFSNLKEIIEKLKKLNHHNLTKLYGIKVDEKKENIFIFMQYVPDSLFKLLDNYSEGLNEGLCLEYSKQILQAVLYLHENDVVGFNLKTKNLLISDWGKIRLSIWTLLHKVIREKKPFYTPPEGKISKVGDIFSLGCVILELLTKKVVKFKTKEDLEELIKNSTKNELVVDLLNRCCNFKPKERLNIKNIIDHELFLPKICPEFILGTKKRINLEEVEEKDSFVVFDDTDEDDYYVTSDESDGYEDDDDDEIVKIDEEEDKKKDDKEDEEEIIEL